MSTAPELKYTDRDVRADESLRELATRYLEQYTGEFEPLIEAKEYLEEDAYLPVALVRKVLNCMRHDSSWCDRLPAPDRRATVLPFRKPSPRKPEQVDKQCDETKGHVRHPWGKTSWGESGWDYYWKYECQGIPFKINRRNRVTVAKVKKPFAAARTGKLIHSINPDGRHTVTWRILLHEYGWASDQHDYLDADGDLNVDLRCKFPSRIERPILLGVDQVQLYIEAQAAIGRGGVRRCPHCIKAEDDL